MTTSAPAARPWTVAPMLGVRDVRSAVDYYCDTLGFTRPRELYGPPDEPVYALLCRGGIEVHLQIRRHGVFPEPREAHDGDAFFFVPDVDALRNELAAKSVTFLRDVQDEPYGVRDFTIETPHGHRLTFGTRID